MSRTTKHDEALGRHYLRQEPKDLFKADREREKDAIEGSYMLLRAIRRSRA